MKQTKRRLLSLLMAFAILCTMIPAAFAAEGTPGGTGETDPSTGREVTNPGEEPGGETTTPGGEEETPETPTAVEHTVAINWHTTPIMMERPIQLPAQWRTVISKRRIMRNVPQQMVMRRTVSITGRSANTATRCLIRQRIPLLGGRIALTTLSM